MTINRVAKIAVFLIFFLHTVESFSQHNSSDDANGLSSAPAPTSKLGLIIEAGHLLAIKEGGPEGSQLYGWALSALGYGSSTSTEFSAVLTELSKIEAQLKTLKQDVDVIYKEIKKSEELTILTATRNAISTIESYWTQYDTLLKTPDTDKKDLKKFAVSATQANGIQKALDDLDLNLISDDSGPGLITIAAQLLAPSANTMDDTEYYQSLHQVLAYNNTWRLRAVHMLVDSYHYLATDEAGATNISDVCKSDNTNPSGNPADKCKLAQAAISQFYNGATSGTGLIGQLELAGAALTNSDYIAMYVPSSTLGSPGKGYLWTRAAATGGISIQYGSAQQFPNQANTKATIILASNVNSGPYGYGSTWLATEEEFTYLLNATGANGSRNAASQWFTGSPNIINVMSQITGVGCVGKYIDVPANSGIQCRSFNSPGGGIVLTYQAPNVITQHSRYDQYVSLQGRLNGGTGQSWGVITAQNNCSNTTKAINPAGWLMPCNSDWVSTRYSKIPSKEKLSSLRTLAESIVK